MDASEIVSTLLILFFFLAAVLSPIIQQLRSAARKSNTPPRRSTGKSDSSRPRRFGKKLRNFFRRSAPEDTRETDPYRDLLREETPPERLRSGEGTRESQPGRTGGSGTLQDTLGQDREYGTRLADEKSSAWPSERKAESSSAGRIGSSWTSSGIEQEAIGTSPRKRRPRGRGFETIRALPPLQRGVIMAELLGKPKALQEKPYDH